MLLSFIATTWLLAMVPGVGQALMLRQTLAQGPRLAVATVLGTSTGLVIWATAAGAGLSAAVLADPVVYRVLLLGGGCVLAGLGLRSLWSSLRRPVLAGVSAAPVPVETNADRRTAYLAGLATNLGNPKAGVFAISLLPLFEGAGGFLPTVSLGLVWSAVTAAWYLVFILLVSRGRSLFTRPAAQRVLGITSGLVLVAVGGAVALGL